MSGIFHIASDWERQHPGAFGAFLEVRMSAGEWNEAAASEFQEEKLNELRALYSTLSREELRTLPCFAAYERYYKKFRKTYHVFLQFESVVLHGKPFPETPLPVRAMFLAEMRGFLLTAVHDLARIQPPVLLDTASGAEQYLDMGKTERTLKEGDMYMRDEEGIISSILYGPDHRTRISPESERLLYTVYAPAGISEQQVRTHLDLLEETLSCFSSGIEIHSRGIVPST
jgi:hypothetical protein